MEITVWTHKIVEKTGLSQTETYANLVKVYGDSATSFSIIKMWDTQLICMKQWRYKHLKRNSNSHID